MQIQCLTCTPDPSGICDSCSAGRFLKATDCVTSCGNNFFEEGNPTNECTACDGSCLTCSGASSSNCLSCNIGTFFKSNQCVNDCGNNFFGEGHPLNQCTACDATCKLCNGPDPDNCTDCKNSAKYLHIDSRCYATCPDNYIGDDSTSPKSCKLCDTGCEICDTTFDNCTRCFDGYFLQTDATCVLACETDQYVIGVYDAVTPLYENECDDCDGSCETCDGPNDDDCLTCPNGTYLQAGECVDPCDDGSFGDDADNTCKTCHIRCLTCDGPDYTECDDCVIDPEADRFHYLPADRTCLSDTECIAKTAGFGRVWIVDEATPYHCTEEPCDGTCRTCNQTEPINCLTCSGGRFLLNTVCVTDCGDSRYQTTDDITGLNICASCNSECLTCEDEPHNCILCQDGTFLFEDNDPANGWNACYHDCPSTHYEDLVTITCEECDPTCLTCDLEATTCTSCFEGRYLLIDECVEECPIDGYFADEDINECVTCNPGCPVNRCTCETYDCCIEQCEDGFWENYVARYCDPCYFGCTKCELSATNCQECQPNFTLVGNQCNDDCPIGKYFTGVGCDDCDPDCYTCSGPNDNNCLSCTGNRYLKGYECLTDCVDIPSGIIWYNDIATNECGVCYEACSACQDVSDNCQGCVGGWVLQTNSCVECSDHHYGAQPGNVCLECHDECKSCNGPNNNDCLSCFGILYLQNNYCQQHCNAGFYKDQSTYVCRNCPNGCDTCTSLASCQICSVNFYLLDERCYGNCPGGYDEYIDVNGVRICAPCHANCLTCSDVGFDNCISCDFGIRFLKDGQCYSSCPPGFSKDRVNNQCVSCNINCQECHQEDLDHCLICNNMYLIDGTCETDCPQGHFPEGNEFVCLTCSQAEGDYIQHCGSALCPGTSIDPNDGTKCIETCGDGLRTTDQYECDDGNNDDGDGCSADCEVEYGWECTGGTATTADTCQDVRPIGYELIVSNSTYYNFDENANLVFFLRFNKTFTLPLGTTIRNYIIIEIDGYNEAVDYDIYGLDRRVLSNCEEKEEFIISENDFSDFYESYHHPSQQLRKLQAIQSLGYQIELKLTQTIRNRNFTVTLFPREDFVDLFGNGLASDTLKQSHIFRYMFYTDVDRDLAKVLYWIWPGIALILVLNVIHMFFYSDVGKNKFYFSFFTTDIMQVTYFFRYINVRWPLNGYRFFEVMARWSDFFIPNLFSNSDKNIKHQSNIEAFERYNITTQFLENAGSPFLLLCVLILFFVFLVLFTQERLYKDPTTNKFYSAMYKIRNSMFQWGVFIDFYLLTAIIFYTYALLQWTQFKEIDGIIPAIIATILFFGAFGFIVYVFLTNPYTLYSEEFMIEKGIKYKKGLHERTVLNQQKEREKAEKLAKELKEKGIIDEKSSHKGSEGELKEENEELQNQKTEDIHIEEEQENKPQSKGIEVAEKQIKDYYLHKEELIEERKLNTQLEDIHVDLDKKLTEVTFRYRNLWNWLKIDPKDSKVNYNVIYIILIIFRKIYVPAILLTLQSSPLAQVLMLQLYQAGIIFVFFYFSFKIFPQGRYNLRMIISETSTTLGLFGIYNMLKDESEEEEQRTSRVWMIIFVFLFNFAQHLCFIIFEEIVFFMAYTARKGQEYRKKKIEEREEREEIEYMQERLQDEIDTQKKHDEHAQNEADKKEAAQRLGKRGFTIADSKRYQELYFDKKPGTKKDLMGAKKTYQIDTNGDEVDEDQLSGSNQDSQQGQSGNNFRTSKTKFDSHLKKQTRKKKYWGMKQDKGYDVDPNADTGKQQKQNFSDDQLQQLMGGAVPGSQQFNSTRGGGEGNSAGNNNSTQYNNNSPNKQSQFAQQPGQYNDSSLQSNSPLKTDQMQSQQQYQQSQFGNQQLQQYNQQSQFSQQPNSLQTQQINVGQSQYTNNNSNYGQANPQQNQALLTGISQQQQEQQRLLQQKLKIPTQSYMPNQSQQTSQYLPQSHGNLGNIGIAGSQQGIQQGHQQFNNSNFNSNMQQQQHINSNIGRVPQSLAEQGALSMAQFESQNGRAENQQYQPKELKQDALIYSKNGQQKFNLN